MTLEFTSAARRDLNRLPEGVVDAVLIFIQVPLQESPHRVGKPLLAPFEGLMSARVGGYRVIYRIDAEHIVIVRVRHRRDAYRT